MGVTHDKWVSACLHRPSYRASLPLPATLPEGFLFARVAAGDTENLVELQNAGFDLIATGVSFEATMPIGTSTSHHVRTARPEDADRVARLAGGAFRYDRFHADARIPARKADQLKSEWARNFFRGQRGDWMVVAESGPEIGGFTLLKQQGSTLVIDLIAVDEPYRGRGLARDMIAYAANTLPGFSAVRVGTQLANVASIRAYEALGFRFTGADHVLHLHNHESTAPES